ncbi:MAG: hypothetical protein ACOVT5_13410, partial [Armatimonadaceae bacterium]
MRSPGRLRLRALVPLLAASLASPAFAQFEIECGSASITSYIATLPPSGSYQDEGLATQACEAEKNAHGQYHRRYGGGLMDMFQGVGVCAKDPDNNRIQWTLITSGEGKSAFSCDPLSSANPSNLPYLARNYSFSESCATRPVAYFQDPGDQSGVVCHRGCRYTYELNPESGYTNQYFPDGSTCSTGDAPLQPPLTPNPDPPDPDPPDPDPDDPDPPDPDPPDPDPPDPDEPDEPEEPEEPDPNEPNQPGQNVDMSGVESRLDALKQSVDVIPPKLDAIAEAIARAGRCVGRGPGDGVVDECDNMASKNPQGNTVSGGGDCTSEPVCTGDQAQCAMVLFAWRNQCATERVADALEGNSDGEPGTPEPGPDLSEYAQDPSTDGLVESIWQDAQDGEMELDTAGFGGSRSCPLLSLNIPAWMGTPNFSAVCNVMSFLANLFFAI